MNRLISVFLQAAIAVGLWAAPAWAQIAPKVTSLGPNPPQTYMWVGNSFFYFNNGMPSYVTGLARGEKNGGPTHRGTMLTIGGSGLDWHDVKSYFRPNAVGSYIFDDQNRIVFNTAKKKYEGVIMIDCSQCPIHPTLAPVFVKYVKKDVAIIRAHGAVPVLFMSWAYADHPEMTAGLAEAYTREGNANDALVIPAGLAFARVLKARPDLVLHAPDKRHPSLAGTYLAAATAYAALYGRSPEENSYTAGLDPELARFLRAEAWAAVKDYFSGKVTN
jgi:hypothetical protein